jgi:hypothetical protein
LGQSSRNGTSEQFFILAGPAPLRKSPTRIRAGWNRRPEPLNRRRSSAFQGMQRTSPTLQRVVTGSRGAWCQATSRGLATACHSRARSQGPDGQRAPLFRVSTFDFRVSILRQDAPGTSREGRVVPGYHRCVLRASEVMLHASWRHSRKPPRAISGPVTRFRGVFRPSRAPRAWIWRG